MHINIAIYFDNIHKQLTNFTKDHLKKKKKRISLKFYPIQLTPRVIWKCPPNYYTYTHSKHYFLLEFVFLFPLKLLVSFFFEPSSCLRFTFVVTNNTLHNLWSNDVCFKAIRMAEKIYGIGSLWSRWRR